MEAQATTAGPLETDADTVCVGVFAGEDIAHDLADGTLQGLLDAGEARREFRKLALVHGEGRRWLVVGLGERDAFDAERARVAAAVAHGRASEAGARTLCWELPHHVDDGVAAGLVEGTLLADYRFDRFKRERDNPEGRLERLIVSAHHDVSGPVAAAAVIAGAQNGARELQNMPPNELTPTALAQRALALGDELDGLAVEVEQRDGLLARGMGAFAAVAQGSYQEPALITLRYEGPGASGPLLGYVGKAVTFDSGGISIKPALKMREMKFDMSGGAAVIEALGAIAQLRLPLRIVGVVGATENLPSGRSIKPGDIVRAMNGTTIEVVNTDAEGRLVLADCLAWAIELGAERIVDIATLTGGVIVALGSGYAALMSNDDDWCAQVVAAGTASGDRVWRLPLDERYAEQIKGIYSDIVNSIEQPKASPIIGAEFLRRFVGDTPWAHIDIAGVSWDTERPYAAKGGSGFGVRLLVELARRLAPSGI